MVRLKDIDEVDHVHYKLFQFHYGSIKGVLLLIFRTGISGFQFHYGSIKGLSSVVNLTADYRFQFHYGSIKGAQKAQGLSVCPIISIPLWFD